MKRRPRTRNRNYKVKRINPSYNKIAAAVRRISVIVGEQLNPNTFYSVPWTQINNSFCCIDEHGGCNSDCLPENNQLYVDGESIVHSDTYMWDCGCIDCSSPQCLENGGGFCGCWE
jgi:hypothetical protein